MQKYNKALVALVAAVVGLLGNFGIVIPESALTVITSALPLVSAGLVYLIPNQTD